MKCSSEVTFCQTLKIAESLHKLTGPSLSDALWMAANHSQSKNIEGHQTYNRDRSRLAQRDVNTMNNYHKAEFEAQTPQDVSMRRTSKVDQQMGEYQRIKHTQGIRKIKMALKLANIRYSFR